MNTGLVDLETLRKQKRKANLRGSKSYCFVRGDKIIKVYASSSDYGYISIDRNSICDFSKYQSDVIVFPDEYLYEKDRKAGEIMNYIKDNSISVSISDKTKVSQLIDNYEQALLDFMTYSNILMCDLCRPNILYSEKNGFHIIDTTEWEINKNNNTSWNIKRFNSQIVLVLLDYLDINTIYYYDYPIIEGKIKENAYKFGKEGQRLYKVLERNLYCEYNLIEFIYAYMDLYQKYQGEELKTLSEAKEMTKVLKKG